LSVDTTLFPTGYDAWYVAFASTDRTDTTIVMAADVQWVRTPQEVRRRGRSQL
jgi:hypothetical protein